VPWIRAHMKKIDQDALPDRETKVALLSVARRRFLEAGYEPIGMDHFAAGTDELARARREGRLRRNFQGYTVIPADDVIGFGISAIGDVRGAFVQNHKKLSTYEQAVGSGRLPVERGFVRDRDDEIRRAVIQELMCNARLVPQAIEKSFGVSFGDYFAEDLTRLRRLADEGLAEIGDDLIRATPTGELFIRNLAMCFDRYWREKYEGRSDPIFSRTV